MPPAEIRDLRFSISVAAVFVAASAEARRDVFIGGLLLLFLLFVGWILNLGNRLNVVSRLYSGQQPYFTGFAPWWFTFKRGCISFAAIVSYLNKETKIVLDNNEASIDISGIGSIDLSDYQNAEIIRLSSSNPAESISAIINVLLSERIYFNKPSNLWIMIPPFELNPV